MYVSALIGSKNIGREYKYFLIQILYHKFHNYLPQSILIYAIYFQKNSTSICIAQNLLTIGRNITFKFERTYNYTPIEHINLTDPEIMFSIGLQNQSHQFNGAVQEARVGNGSYKSRTHDQLVDQSLNKSWLVYKGGWVVV